MRKEIIDPETGIKLVYSWDDTSGWSFTVSGYASREEMHKAISICRKHWPETPSHLKEKIDKHNKELVEFCRSVPIDRD